MSAVLTQPETTAQRPHWLADDTVDVEPVSPVLPCLTLLSPRKQAILSLFATIACRYLSEYCRVFCWLEFFTLRYGAAVIFSHIRDIFARFQGSFDMITGGKRSQTTA